MALSSVKVEPRGQDSHQSGLLNSLMSGPTTIARVESEELRQAPGVERMGGSFSDDGEAFFIYRFVPHNQSEKANNQIRAEVENDFYSVRKEPERVYARTVTVGSRSKWILEVTVERMSVENVAQFSARVDKFIAVGERLRMAYEEVADAYRR